MRFLCLYKPARPEGTPPTAEEMTKMGELINEMTAARVLLATEGCQPSINGSRVRFEKGVFTVTDGPFTESKELVAGFALIDVASRAEATGAISRATNANPTIRTSVPGPGAGSAITPAISTAAAKPTDTTRCHSGRSSPLRAR